MGLSNKLKTLSSGAVYCDWCGRYMKNTRSNVFNANVLDVGALVHAAKKNFCSAKCKRAYQEAHAKDNSSVGASSGGATEAAARAAKATIAAEAAAEKRAEEQAQKAEHKARLDAITNMVFDTENEENFLHQFISVCEDYKGLKPGFFADKDFKKAYVTRLQKELNILLASKPELHTKVNGYWDDAKKSRAEKEKKIHIISAAIIVVAFIIGCIADGVGTGFLLGFIGAAGACYLEGLKFNKKSW